MKQIPPQVRSQDLMYSKGSHQVKDYNKCWNGNETKQIYALNEQVSQKHEG